MYGALDISTSGLVAQRIRMDTYAGNIANAPMRGYKRRVPVFATGRHIRVASRAILRAAGTQIAWNSGPAVSWMR